MNQLVQALLSSWEWRPFIIITLVLFGTFYTRGWLALRHKGGGTSRIATKKRLVFYLGGLAALALSLLSPIDRLGTQLFFMHMIQHLLSIMVAAPLLWLGNPLPMITWGLPYPARSIVSGMLAKSSPIRRALVIVTKPGLAWLIFIAVYLGWHDPNAYNLALRREWVHDIEHLTFFWTAMLFWWHITNAAPHLHRSLPVWGRMALLLATIPPNMLAGVAISFAEQPIYTFYESIPRIWGVTVMQDQMLGGIIMWIPGSMMFLVAALIVASQMLNEKSTAQRQKTKPVRYGGEKGNVLAARAE